MRSVGAVGWVGPAIVGGILGSAIVGATIANGYGPQYVVEPGWEPYGAYRVRGPVGCPGRLLGAAPVVDRFGNMVGYSRPRFFCPEMLIDRPSIIRPAEPVDRCKLRPGERPGAAGFFFQFCPPLPCMWARTAAVGQQSTFSPLAF